FFQAEDGIRDFHVTGVQTCALPIWPSVRCCRRARGAGGPALLPRRVHAHRAARQDVRQVRRADGGGAVRDEAPVLYVLDANVLMEAHRRYYAFDLCPGFWECLEHYCGEGCVVSLDRVRDEIMDGDALAEWAASAPEAFFVSTADPEVVRLYQDIMA